MAVSRVTMITEHQTRVLRMIEQDGGSMMLTNSDEGQSYTTLTGNTIRADTAKLLIKKGYVVPNRDSMYDLDPQTWKVRSR
jgi:hypothetical protein